MHVYCSVQRWIIIFVSSVLFLLVVLAWYSLSFLKMLSFITCSVCVCVCVWRYIERGGEREGERRGVVGSARGSQPASILPILPCCQFSFFSCFVFLCCMYVRLFLFLSDSDMHEKEGGGA